MESITRLVWNPTQYSGRQASRANITGSEAFFRSRLENCRASIVYSAGGQGHKGLPRFKKSHRVADPTSLREEYKVTL